jgi:hypothetical protein
MSNIKPMSLPRTRSYILQVLAAPVLMLVITGPVVLLRAAVVKVLWQWFAVPEGLKPISLGMAFGAVLLVGLFLSPLHPRDNRALWEIYTDRVLEALIVLVLGFVGALCV